MIGPQQKTLHSDDVHCQAKLLHAWDQSYFQLGVGPFAGSVKAFGTDSIRIFREVMNRAVFQTGGLPGGRLAFGLPVGGQGGSCICGEDGSRNSVLVFSGQSGFEFTSPDMFEFIGVEIDALTSDDPVFVAMARKLEHVLSGRRSIVIEPGRAAEMQRLLSGILAEPELGRRFEDRPDQAAAFGRGLVGQLLDVLQGIDPDQAGTSRRHWGTVARIRHLVTEGDGFPLSVAELTLELSLSRRTLQNACQSILGMSPIQFLRALRLSEARKRLQVAGSVTEVATQFGFWHLGYFSRDYHAMFGELPSTTIQRRA